MNERLQFIPFTSPADRGWAKAMEIYRRSFPYKEQRSEEDHIRALADPAFRAEGIWRGDEFVGILYYWHTDAWDYVEHLAVCASLRGQNLGSEVFGAFCRDRRVILEIDPPVDEISVRRLHFYRRLGFVENPHEYIHPSYRQPFEPHRLVLLSARHRLPTTKRAASPISSGRPCSATPNTRRPINPAFRTMRTTTSSPDGDSVRGTSFQCHTSE